MIAVHAGGNPMSVRHRLKWIVRHRERHKNELHSDLDYLVYSSHKTGTQSLKVSLQNSGYKTAHLHSLRNMGLTVGESVLTNFLDGYLEANGTRLTVISAFRLPMERHISSFFQWHGTRPVRTGEKTSFRETIIAQRTVPELRRLFVESVLAGSNPGRRESLHELSGELGVAVEEFTYDPATRLGHFGNPTVNLVLMRYDDLISGFPAHIEKALGLRLAAKTANLSIDKWYRGIRDEFTESLTLPAQAIHDLHAEKRDLIDLFYPGQYDIILENSIRTFCATGT